jgi:hypothetical protein
VRTADASSERLAAVREQLAAQGPPLACTGSSPRRERAGATGVKVVGAALRTTVPMQDLTVDGL